MASENKKSKLKNSGAIAQMLKNSSLKLKRGLFFTASQKKKNKKIITNETIW